jgi:hypothetical protein
MFERIRAFRDWPAWEQWEQRARRRGVGLILAPFVPATVGFAIAFSHEDILAVAAIWAVTLIVDIAIMLAIRRRLPKRE